ncbi:MAG: lysylphosphatidylglycerol synthase domain-containing protein [Cytophagaceae bacterium]|jgi:hypothetical protein|nr:lysylphosphatidylglycerol synthase domain-containing protein [Cytophagaceae bacterium]
MTSTIKHLNTGKFLQTLQIIVSAAALLYVGYKIVDFCNWNSFFITIKENQRAFILFILLQILLSALNISIEAIKWKQLTSILRPFRFYESLRQVLWGVRMGMITPIRVGEPVGKALLLGSGSRTAGFVLSLAGSVLQNCVIGIAGAAALVVLGRSRLSNSAWLNLLIDNMTHYVPIIVAIVIVLTIGCWLFWQVLRKTPHWKQMGEHIRVVRKLGIKRIIGIFGLTAARYALFSFQMWLVLRFFGVAEVVEVIFLIPVYYLFVTFIPSLALLDIGIRGSVALFVFGWLSSDVAAIVTSAFTVWILNIALPSLVGIVFLKPKNSRI